VRLARHRHLDALCGAYLLGTLRPQARRRFARALQEEPLVALRLAYWQRTFAVKYSEKIAIAPRAGGWQRLQRELDLARYRVPWWRRTGFWRAWAVAASAALAIALALPVAILLRGTGAENLVEVAVLQGASGGATVSAALSPDRRVLTLRAARPVLANNLSSYELWLLPSEGGAPISLAVLGSLDARIDVNAQIAPRVRAGAKLAVSVEPAGGSPSGAPTGPVIMVGEVRA